MINKKEIALLRVHENKWRSRADHTLDNLSGAKDEDIKSCLSSMYQFEGGISTGIALALGILMEQKEKNTHAKF